MWAAGKERMSFYLINLSFFASVSYAMGYANFLIGQFLSNKQFFQSFAGKYMKKTFPLLRKYGLFLIIIAAMTPVPWSASSLIVGSAGYPSKKFLIYGLSRLFRFALYGFFVYQAAKI
jgi:membrane protein YqaA with SNARE-associated domain